MAQEGTTTRTIRIERELDRLLDELAKGEANSVNALINRALRKFVQWDAHAEKFAFVTLPGRFLQLLLDGTPDDTLRGIARSAAPNMGREMIQFWFGQISLENVLGALELFGARYGGMFRFEHTHHDGEHVITLSHDLGHKWSIVLEESLTATFRELLGKQVQTEATDRLVIARL